MIASLSDKHNEITLSGTSFKHTKKEEFEQLVKKNALDKVIKKKLFYEKALGVKLIPVTFSEANVGLKPTHGADLFEEEIIVTGIRASKESAYSNKREVANRSENSFDEVKYHAEISVEFRVD